MILIIPGKLCLSSLLVLSLYVQIKYPNLTVHSNALSFLISMLWLWVIG